MQIAIYLPAITFNAFPLLFMGLCSLVGAALALLLPETLGSPYIETLEDVENMGEYSKPFFSWWTTKQLKEHIEKQQGKAI